MFDFPDNPVAGQVFQPVGGPAYTWWNGVWRDTVALGDVSLPMSFEGASLVNNAIPAALGGLSWDVLTKQDPNLYGIEVWRATAGQPFSSAIKLQSVPVAAPGTTYRVNQGIIGTNLAVTPSLGRQWSNPAAPPPPTPTIVISSLSPDTGVHGTSLQVAVIGVGLLPGDRIAWDGGSVGTTYIWGGQLTSETLMLGAARTVPVWIQRGAEVSNTLNFTIT